MKKLVKIEVYIKELLLDKYWAAIHIDQLEVAVHDSLTNIINKHGMPTHFIENNSIVSLPELNVTVVYNNNLGKLADVIARAIYYQFAPLEVQDSKTGSNIKGYYYD